MSEILVLPVDASSSFQEIGADSILAVEMQVAISDVFRLDVPIEWLYECENFRALARAIEELE